MGDSKVKTIVKDRQRRLIMSNDVTAGGLVDSHPHGNLPGTASLIAELDRKQMVLLRDGRTLIGALRSVDQFANLVLQDCIERIHVGKQFGDIPRGIFVVRGENVVLLVKSTHRMTLKV